MADHLLERTKAFLRFLEGVANLKKKRVSAYGEGDTVLWFADLPRDLSQDLRNALKSAFTQENPEEIPDLWLEVRKKRRPEISPLPNSLRNWVSQDFQIHPDKYVDRSLDQMMDLLNEQIAIPGDGVTKVYHLKDYPTVKDHWVKYLRAHWQPWVREMIEWLKVELLYEKVDFMRRQIEGADERYELVMCVGMLCWRDSSGVDVKRHVLTAPAEITLDAERGVLTVGPAESFERFRVELDMLEPKDRPDLKDTDIDERLEDLDIRAWDRKSVAEILRIIANKTTSNAQVYEDEWGPPDRTDRILRVSYAPALILRQRRYTAYEEVVRGFIELFEESPKLSITRPWKSLLEEGSCSDGFLSEADETSGSPIDPGERFYFPLPTNDEQRQIAERIRVQPHVLVKGPPGTGKSHTIANLICHLLAKGERILITAQAPKALAVLRDLLPAKIRGLCVTAFGSSREDHRMLEDCVRGIQGLKNRWNSKQQESNIALLEQELRQMEDELARLDRQLRECRESETHTHELPGGYRGTAARIARQVEEAREAYEWFPELNDNIPFPLQSEDVGWFAQFHTSLTDDVLEELKLNVCENKKFPGHEEFKREVEYLIARERELDIAREGLSQEQLRAAEDLSERFSQQELGNCIACLEQIEQTVAKTSSAIGCPADGVLKELLVEEHSRWDSLEKKVSELLLRIDAACERAGNSRIDVPLEVENSKLLADARERLEHFAKGGWRGWGFLAPRVVWRTRYIEKKCRVGGLVPRDQKSLDMLVGYLELRQLLQEFGGLWSTDINSDRQTDPRRLVVMVRELVQLLGVLRERGREFVKVVPSKERMTLVEPERSEWWLKVLKTALALYLLNEEKSKLQRCIDFLQSVENPHQCILDFIEAIETRSVDLWREAWNKRQELVKRKEDFKKYEELRDCVLNQCPELKDVLDESRGKYEWVEKLCRFEQAWNWSAARSWLKRVSDPGRYERLAEKRRKLHKQIEKKIEDLAALKAWVEFFERLDPRTEQNLVAWTKAVSRIGKGTGKHAYKHRRTAREYLMECIPRIPAWIMPLYKLWETTKPEPGAFDTIIVDEASQAGVDALLLFLLGKRIIVVGDDKQNSPEAVGIHEDDIARVARDHLKDFHFRDEFRPDTSLYDHAERVFRNLVSLREHFRCVPEIIRFSNDLFYPQAPLIPLRQPPPNRLRPPLKPVFVEQGFCEGDGQRIINRAEAEEIVRTIQQCLENDAYNGKTMGVITLQGHLQAELIDRMLAEVLEPKVREERKLRCGVPASFQGDQRDVIFLSLVVAPNHQYRALTGLPDQRRFNVAMSRARDQVWLFHSVKPEELSQDDLRWKLLNFFYNPHWMASEEIYEELDRLERELRGTRREHGEQPEPYESWFEVDVAIELLRRKYRVRPQFEVAGYRIDLVVEGRQNRLAVECDGEEWHGADKFESDMARQRQLERAGWRFVRVRESEFYADRESTVSRIIEACDELGIYPDGMEEEIRIQSELIKPSEQEELQIPDRSEDMVLSGVLPGMQPESETIVEDYGLEDRSPKSDGGSLTDTSEIEESPDVLERLERILQLLEEPIDTQQIEERTDGYKSRSVSMNDDEGILAEFEKNSTELVRIVRRKYRGYNLVDVRVYYEDDMGNLRPTKSGIALRLEKWQEFVRMVKEVSKKLGF